MAETPRTLAPERPPPPVPQPQVPPTESSPSTPREEYHTPSPSLDEAREEALPQQETNGSAVIAKSPPLTPVRLPSPHRLLPPNSPIGNGQEGDSGHEPAAGRRPQLRLSLGLVRTPSHGSLHKSPSPSPSPTPPSPLTPAPVNTPTPNRKSGQSTPKRAEAWKRPASPAATTAIAVAVPFDPVEEDVTSPLHIGKAQLDHQRAATQATENGGAATTVPPGMAAVAAVGERRALPAALRLVTAVLSLAAFSVMVSARTSGWDGDYFARYEQYRYAVGVNVVVCIYSIAQAFGEICRLVWPRFTFLSTSNYFSLFLDQVLAYLLMSASSAAASRNDLWVSTFGKDPFNKKINSAVWLSFLGFIALAANSLISTANLFSMA